MNFADAFLALKGFPPLRWQERLYQDYFAKGEIPSALDLPTGLGKTSVMAVWLVARALGADTLPRRLVYVVDRRAVVDQATDDAEKLRNALEGAASNLKTLLGLDGDAELPISTLRGQHADNRDWLANPAAPAIVVGTVDMIGSRLLFSGYGVSRRMRPYHAGLLGVDALIVLDEAHLVPPFEKLVAAIADGQAPRTGRIMVRQTCYAPRDREAQEIAPPLRLLSLSATGRNKATTKKDSEAMEAFRLLPEDDGGDDFVKNRLNAAKALIFDADSENKKRHERLADAAWAQSNEGETPARYLVFCNSREDAEKIAKDLNARAEKKWKAEKSKESAPKIELLTGARRVYERQQVKNWLEEQGFFDGRKLDRPAFLVATSAGEVGVDMDADHMICDLVEWERMVQRLGRVNRAGRRHDTRVIVIDASREHEKDDNAAAARRETTRALLERLPQAEDGGRNASPLALLKLRGEAPDAIEAASTPAPLRPALTRALVDAWSMTSLEEHAGRPEVGPWLRGWKTDDRPQARVVWRTWLPAREGGETSVKEIDAFFDAAPPHLIETLETYAEDVASWLVKRASALDAGIGKPNAPSEDDTAAPEEEEKDKAAFPEPLPLSGSSIVAIAFSPSGKVKTGRDDRHLLYTLKYLSEAQKREKDALVRDLAGATLVIDARLGGLSGGGHLDDDAPALPPTADAEEDGAGLKTSDGAALVADDGKPVVGFRIRRGRHDSSEDEKEWRSTQEFILSWNVNGEKADWLEIDSFASEDSRALYRRRNIETLDAHHAHTGEKAAGIAKAVFSGQTMRDMLEIAAILHDAGKAADRWQNAFRARKNGRPYAKTRGPIDHAILCGYRHEVGSIERMTDSDRYRDLSDEALRNIGRFQKLPEDLRDLALHLVAAHHGAARPVIGVKGCDWPEDAMRPRAAEVALRFARLQKQWGPWGLAWLEALLRAADQQASRESEENAANNKERA